MTIALLLAAMVSTIGDYRVDLMPSRNNISPMVTFANRSFTFCYRTDGWLKEGDRTFQYHAYPTNVFAVRRQTVKGLRADYVHTLYAEDDAGVRTTIGFCSNEVVFAEGRIGVRATLYPAEPGRYRMYHSDCASQVIVFHDFAARWVGSTLELHGLDKSYHVNELMPHDRFDPEAWGLSANDTGPGKIVRFGNVPDIISMVGGVNGRVNVNRYVGGFEMSAGCRNPDVMHKPLWAKPLTWTYYVTLEK